MSRGSSFDDAHRNTTIPQSGHPVLPKNWHALESGQERRVRDWLWPNLDLLLSKALEDGHDLLVDLGPCLHPSNVLAEYMSLRVGETSLAEILSVVVLDHCIGCDVTEDELAITGVGDASRIADRTHDGLNRAPFHRHLLAVVGLLDLIDDVLLGRQQPLELGQVVWMGYAGKDYEIFMFDGNKVQQISESEGYNWNPQINDHGEIVWELTQGAYSEILLYKEGKITRLTAEDDPLKRLTALIGENKESTQAGMGNYLAILLSSLGVIFVCREARKK